jgi:NAD(P)H-dependent flavin oxidoreductase YrpB (nitropropane dioxygenase family)
MRQTGDLDAGLAWAGQFRGLIRDIHRVAECIRRPAEEARTIIQRQLPA